MTLRRRLLGFFLVVFCVTVTFETSAGKKEDQARRERAERIRTNDKYYTGVGFGETYEDADRMAIAALCKSISLVYSNSTSATDTNEEELFNSQTAISTYVTLNNTECYEVSTTPGKWELIRYVEKRQVENDIALRAEKIKLWVMRGRELEKRLELASALKFFHWAYTLASATSKAVKIDVDGQVYEAKTWLNSHITTILTSITPTLDGVESHPGELDEYSVNLKMTYLDEPVADLDFSYVNNGNRVRGQHVKNGFASLAFEKLPTNNIELDIEYKYLDEIEGFDPELKSAAATVKSHSFDKAKISLPCKGVTPEKFKVGEVKLSKEEKKEIAAAAAIAPPTSSIQRQRIKTQEPESIDGETIFNAMRRLRDAIDRRDYTGAKALFTENGYALFMKMVQSGKVETIKSKTGDDFKAEVAGDFIRCRSIPVTIKYNGGHKVSENLLCRFNSDLKIESIAYSLSKIAEDDIFRQNSWSLPARYAILQFMEDYQTAYALKNIEYIEKIYSDDAVIISGKRNPHRKSQDGNFFYTDSFTYTRETKDEFIKRLRREFPNKKYIKLTFEDNEIQEQSGIFSNIFWIEIKQIYRSSNYEDDGYLTLMIDMREADPMIKVRTWAPGKIPLNELMRRFTME